MYHSTIKKLTLLHVSSHPWEVHGHNASKVGANMAEAALGSLATMVYKNPRINITGTVPYLGSKLNVRVKYFYSLLIVILVVHTIVFVSAYLATTKEWQLLP